MENPNYYLTSGDKTQIGENVKKKVEQASNNSEGKSTEEIVKDIMISVRETCMKRNSKDNKKFKRSAEEILEDGYRNGCCDSSTLFVTLCRACGIPAAQIVTVHLNSVLNNDFGRGHFYSAFFNKESNSWFFVNSDVDQTREFKFRSRKFDESLKTLDQDYYIFGIFRDYSEFDIDGLKIDSTRSMNQIHKMVYENLLKNGFLDDRKKSLSPENIYERTKSVSPEDKNATRGILNELIHKRDKDVKDK